MPHGVPGRSSGGVPGTLYLIDWTCRCWTSHRRGRSCSTEGLQKARGKTEAEREVLWNMITTVLFGSSSPNYRNHCNAAASS
jgi:hypothetical protein